MNREELKSIIQEVVQEQTATNTPEEKGTEEKGSGEPVTDNMGAVRQASGPVIRSGDREEPGIGAARFVRAIAAAKGDAEKAVRFAERAHERVWRDEMGERVKSTLQQAGEFNTGGFVLPPEYSEEIIGLLRNRTVVRAAGARTMPMDSGSLTFPKMTDGTSASYIGEAQPTPETNVEGGHVHLHAKKLAAMVQITNELLDWSPGNRADQMVRDDLTQNISVVEDQAFLRGPGSQFAPRGIRWWALEDNVTDRSNDSYNDPQDAEEDITQLIDSLEGKNVPLDSLAIFMNPRVKNFLGNLRHDNGGQRLFEDLRMVNSPNIWGIPVYASNSVPEDELIMARMSDAMIGEASTMQIVADSNASFVDSSGNTISAFQNDLTLVRAIVMHDFAMRREESVAVIANRDFSVS